MENESQGNDLEGELDGEYDEEVVLCGLELHRQQGLVVFRQVLLHGHHDAGCDDGDQNRPLEGRAEELRNIGFFYFEGMMIDEDDPSRLETTDRDFVEDWETCKEKTITHCKWLWGSQLSSRHQYFMKFANPQTIFFKICGFMTFTRPAGKNILNLYLSLNSI